MTCRRKISYSRFSPPRFIIAKTYQFRLGFCFFSCKDRIISVNQVPVRAKLQFIRSHAARFWRWTRYCFVGARQGSSTRLPKGCDQNHVMKISASQTLDAQLSTLPKRTKTISFNDRTAITHPLGLVVMTGSKGLSHTSQISQRYRLSG